MPPRLLTPRRIAAALGVPIARVLHILRTRPHITPAAHAGRQRVYRSATLAQVRYELNKQDARRAAREGVARADAE